MNNSDINKSIGALVQEFQAPAAKYRGAPFWSWNGDLQPEELRRQIRMFHQAGLGGFFMHARVGLKTEYLSPRWFECVRACIDEAQKLGLKAYLYDEDRWPSGSAGGMVTKDKRYRLRRLWLQLDDGPQPQAGGTVLTRFALTLDGETLKSCRALPASGKVSLRRSERLLTALVCLAEETPWHNNQTYLDTMNPEAVARFLEVTYDAYQREVGQFFGQEVPAIFTDEPYYGNYAAVPEKHAWLFGWTDALPKVFQERYGYNLLPHLPELLFNLPDGLLPRTRRDYFDCITHLFTTAYGKQIGEWCEKHGIAFTGHLLGEDTLSSQTSCAGACMRFYEHMQIPGIDQLTERRNIFDTAKQMTSIARQFGRRWRLSETYGCTGWDFPLAGHKALGDWQLALGINIRCQHLAWYTMAGQAKRDYPAAISWQSPWFQDYAVVEDYFARLNVILSQGQERRDILVLHPIESMWLLNGTAAAKQYDQVIIELRNRLLAQNLDFDYGDEEVMSRIATVRKSAGKAILQVGKAEYRVVVLPQLITIRQRTLDLLDKFVAAGGTVLRLGTPPQYIEAQKASLKKFYTPSSLEQLPQHLASWRLVSIKDEQDREIPQVLHLLREGKDFIALFICNTSFEGENFPDNVTVRERITENPLVEISLETSIPEGMLPYLFNPEDGSICVAEHQCHAEGIKIIASLPRFGSLLFILSSEKLLARREPDILECVGSISFPDEPWPIRCQEANVLVLDRAKYRLGEGKWQAAQDLLHLDCQIREQQGELPRGGQMTQPWAQQPVSKPTIPLELEFNFDCQALPAGPLFLALERPREWQIALNGRAVSPDDDCGWWVDQVLRKLPLEPAAFRLGRNSLLLKTNYDLNSFGLESLFLLGDFGVQLVGDDYPLLQPPVRSLQIGDWVPQGLPFYAGNILYEREFLAPQLSIGQHLRLSLPDYRGTAVKVYLNDQPVGIRAWEPYTFDLTEKLQPGRNRLGIEILGSRRNSHGPFYTEKPWCRWVGPGQFLETESERRQLVPCGMLQQPQLEIAEDGFPYSPCQDDEVIPF